jgi:dual specificity protein phosphatase-like protein
MDVIRIDERGGLYLAPDIDDWSTILSHGISAVIDLDGDLDHGVPTTPGGLLYVYFPFEDETLPDPEKLHALAAMGAELVGTGQRVLCHCLLGFNRSALVAGLILVHLGMSGPEAVALLRERRPGALYNETFAAYLESLPGRGHLRHADQTHHAIRMEGKAEER